MKVLIAYCYTLPHVGGLWTYVRELKQALEKKRHSVSILAADAKAQKYYLLDTDGAVRIRTISDVVKKIVEQYYQKHWPKLDQWIINHEVFRYSFELAASYLGLEQYDVIHAQDAESTRAISRVKPKNTPLIGTFHCSNTRETFALQTRAPGSLRWKYVSVDEALAVEAADSLIVPSQWLKTTLLNDYHPDEKKICVIPHGIDIHQFRERMKQPSQLTRKDNTIHIACVARLAREKGHVHLLNALATLKKVRTDWVCWLVGDGYLRSKLIEHRNRLHLQDHVLFVGKQNNVPSLLKQVDIFVLPSLLETLGYAAMEAQLAGKAVVVSDACGLPEVVTHMETGLISPAGKSEPLFQQLKALMEDPLLMKRLSKNAQRWGNAQWPIAFMGQRTQEVYRRTVENQAPRSKPLRPFSQLLEKYSKGSKQPHVWQRIAASLPSDYTIPDRRLVRGIADHLKGKVKSE